MRTHVRDATLSAAERDDDAARVREIHVGQNIKEERRLSAPLSRNVGRNGYFALSVPSKIMSVTKLSTPNGFL